MHRQHRQPLNYVGHDGVVLQPLQISVAMRSQARANATISGCKTRVFSKVV